MAIALLLAITLILKTLNTSVELDHHSDLLEIETEKALVYQQNL